MSGCTGCLQLKLGFNRKPSGRKERRKKTKERKDDLAIKGSFLIKEFSPWGVIYFSGVFSF